jgi:hypothetical protein
MLSFSMFCSSEKIFAKLRERSASSVTWSGTTKCLFLLQILLVPALPVKSVQIPDQVCLKIFCTYFNLSNADIFELPAAAAELVAAF